MKHANSKNRIQKQKFDNKVLIIILVALIVAIVALIITMVAIKIDQAQNTPSTNVAKYTSAESEKIGNNQVGDIYPLNIVANEHDLNETIDKYDKSKSYKKEFLSTFDTNFLKHNYLVLGYNDYCSDEFNYKNTNSNGNRITIYLSHLSTNGYCEITGILLFIEIPKNITNLDQISYDVEEIKSNKQQDYPDVVLKPIIYLYPESEAEIEITLGAPDRLTTTYPKYQDGWRVIARPDGTLTDLKTGRELYSLYWEGIRNYTPDLSEGFIVKGEDSATFLEEKLDYLGLNAKESEEFIVYWLPKLESSPYNLIKFESKETVEHDMPIIVTENGKERTPDTLIRVRMVYKPLEYSIDVTEQQLHPAPTRHGFTIVEWGGTKS